MEDLELTDGFWRGRRVLVTGHTGFKGAWLCLMLRYLGAEVHGYALPPPTTPSLFELAGIEPLVGHNVGNVLDASALAAVVDRVRPQTVLHLAARSLVLESYADPVDTFATNVMGTVNLLQVLRGVAELDAVVVATSDKCYRNDGQLWGYRESDPLGGGDPYSASKACTEIAAAAFADAFFNDSHAAAVATVRAGNVIGGGDWAPRRLLPDLLEAYRSGRTARIRRPDAVRPWQHVLEPLRGYLLLAERLSTNRGLAGAWNFGPALQDARPVAWIADRMASLWPGDARWHAEQPPGEAEAQYLRLDCSKTHMLLGWQPRLDLQAALGMVVGWQRRVDAGESARVVSEEQIAVYLGRAQAVMPPAGDRQGAV